MIGSRCNIHGVDLCGVIVGRLTYAGDADRFAVRYMDRNGNPQERWFTAGEITFNGGEAASNVVALERRRVA